MFSSRCLAQHQPEIPAGARHGASRLINDVAQIVEPAGIGGFPAAIHFSRAWPPSTPRRKAEDLDLDAAALQGARQDVGLIAATVMGARASSPNCR